ncbi:MAG: fumarylacetoacetate hydrolase family protein [Actinomycetes bacterium]
MRVARFVHEGRARTGLVVDEGIVDLGDVDPVDVLLGTAPVVTGAPEIALRAVRLLPPIAAPRKFLAIGLNYADHCAETGQPHPAFPVFFNKQVTCLTGHGGEIHVPRVSAMVDYEGELGVVIGRRCRHVPIERALEVIAGYTIVDDVTVRDWQLRAPTMTIGKSFDTHGPVGPWIVSADEIPDPQALRIRTTVSGDVLQDAPTSGMIFSVAEQIATLSTSCTLEPGDIIATGTPAGVGIVRQPPRWLVPGDTVRIEIDGIGVLENPVVAEPDDTAVIA